MWIWGAPNQLRAIWKVLVGESALVKRVFKREIKFVVSTRGVLLLCCTCCMNA